jgi:hypothetical protein
VSPVVKAAGYALGALGLSFMVSAGMCAGLIAVSTLAKAMGWIQ